MKERDRIGGGYSGLAYDVEIISPEIEVGFIADVTRVALRKLKSGRGLTEIDKKSIGQGVIFLEQARYFGENVLRRGRIKDYRYGDYKCYQIFVKTIGCPKQEEIQNRREILKRIRTTKQKLKSTLPGKTENLEELLLFFDNLLNQVLAETAQPIERTSGLHAA